jgi:signal transduction histidine kinase/ligand-binding sensor domain-containing protein
MSVQQQRANLAYACTHTHGGNVKRCAALISASCAFMAAMFACSSLAQTRSLDGFQHTAWPLQSGAPSQIQALAQTRDGFLWMGTANGLFRFDGVTFEAYRPLHGEQFPHAAIQCLTATEDGGLWIGYTLGDTGFLKDGVLTTQPFRTHVHLGGGTVYSILTRRDGSTWAATNDGVIRFASGVWQDAETDTNTRVKMSTSLFEDSGGTLWMATQDFVYRLPQGMQRFQKTSIEGGDTAIFTQAHDGSLWIAEPHGIYPITAANGTLLASRGALHVENTVNDLGFDRQGSLWIAGSHNGVTRIERPNEALALPPAAQEQSMVHVSASNGLTSELALALLEDREGDMWVSTSTGLDRFRPNAITPAPVPARFDFFSLATGPGDSLLIGTRDDGLQRLSAGKLTKLDTGHHDTITSVYQAPDGKLWLGGHAELGYMQGGHYNPVALPEELKTPFRDTQSMTSGPDGDLWLQVQTRLGIFRLHGNTWSNVANPLVRGGDIAVVMKTDDAGRVWAGYLNSHIVIFDKDKRRKITKEDGLTVGNVLALFPSADGMWIGGEHGLDIMPADHPVELRFEGSLPVEGISGISRSDDGSLWLNSLTGILRVSSSEVEHALKDHSHPMQYRLFNYLDGLSGKAPQLRPLPSILKGVNETLWFTTTNGIASIDASSIRTNSVVPAVVIKALLADGISLDPSGPITLSKGANDLQIDYTALSISMPERVRFRYKLEGYDKQWQDVGTRRQAFYTHLPPGRYRFQVVACNNDGLWNDTGASVPFYLPPTFSQSWYFKAGLVVLFFGATWLIYLLRMKREAAKLRERMQERFSERERIARDLHDTLFQSVEGSLLHLNAVTSRLPVKQEARDQLREAYEEVDRVMGQARSLVFDLRQPVDSQDLAATTKLFAEEVGDLSEVQVEVQVHGQQMLLAPPVHDEVLKILKECIWNAFRHAEAQHITVTIHYSNRFFEVSVKDDGVGINPEILKHGGREGHWGLPGMRERAAALKALLVLQNCKDGGAEIVLKVNAREAYTSSGWSFLASWRRLLQV